MALRFVLHLCEVVVQLLCQFLSQICYVVLREVMHRVAQVCGLQRRHQFLKAL